MLFRALLAWLAIMAVETIHGIVRRVLLVPVVGEPISNQIGVFLGSLLIILVVYFLYVWLKVYSRGPQLLVGLLWCFLTVLFEVGVGLVLGYGMDQMLDNYNPMKGGLMSFGLAVLLFSLVIVAKFRSE